MHRGYRSVLFLSSTLTLVLAACSGGSDGDAADSSAAGTGNATGGAAHTGGSTSVLNTGGGSAAATQHTGGATQNTGGSTQHTGGATQNTGGSSGTGGTTPASTGGATQNTGGASTVATGGNANTGGSTSTGGRAGTGGGAGTGGRSGTGGAADTGGTDSGSTGGANSGGSADTGGTGPVATGGTTNTGGDDGTGGSEPTGDCTFTVNGETSSAIPTVGIVTWSTDLSSLTEAKIQFELADGSGSTLEAPVDLEDTSGADFRTLLLGMKAQKEYTYRIVATSGSTSCTSEDYSITTGALASGVPTVNQQVTNAQALAGGFIVTNSGGGGGGGIGGGGGGSSMAIIIDADGDVVWWASAPSGTSRAHMSYDGKRMWMLSLNVGNSGGEMRWVSMDGLDGQNNVSGLSAAHHDFCVTSSNKVAALVWASNGQDPPSNLIEADPDGNLTTVATIDSSVYQSSSFHANAIHYIPSDDTFTISDRNPNLFVKINHQGQPLWQLGGSCTNAPAPKCVAGSWQVNHGHHWLDDGYFVFFNNSGSGGGGGPGGGGGGSSVVYAYQLDESGSSFSATQLWSYSGGSSGTLGDVQALPNGNTLITYSNSGSMTEIDASQSVVQTLSVSGLGYADWRETLYGPPPRL